MKPIPRRLQGIVAAGLLSILTVSVFARSQYSGPESAVLRYQYAVGRGDRESISLLVIQEIDSEVVVRLNESIFNLLANSRSSSLASVQHMGREATVDVVYATSAFGTVLVRYHLVKPRDAWQVDAERTRGMVSRARLHP